MSHIDDLPPLRDVIRDHGLAARKALGQNFLLDLNLTMKISRAAGDLTNATVLEIGPGPGGLTRALLANGARRVVAIERDARCLPALEQIAMATDDRLHIIEGDALSLNHRDVLADAGTDLENDKIIIAANLPYNIATPLFTRWVGTKNWPPFWHGMTLMFQKEVAQRITASPLDKAWGRLGVLSSWRTYSEIAFDLPPQAFTPAPKVTSSVVMIQPNLNPVQANIHAIERITQAAFGQRRKMLRQSLKSEGGEALLMAADIDGTRRAETLSIEEFAALANALDGI